MGWRKGTNSPSVRVTHPRASTTVRGDISVHVCTINDGGEVAVVVMPQGSEEIDSHHGPGQLGEILQWGGTVAMVHQNTFTTQCFTTQCFTTVYLVFHLPPSQPPQKSRCLASSPLPQTPEGGGMKQQPYCYVHPLSCQHSLEELSQHYSCCIPQQTTR